MNKNRGSSRGEPVGGPSVRAAWHKARNRRTIRTEIRDADDKVVGYQKSHTMSPGLSLKVWVKQQITDAFSAKAEKDSPAWNLAVLCSAWLFQKSPKSEQNARLERLRLKGGMISQQKRCVRTGQHSSHKKGSGGKVGSGAKTLDTLERVGLALAIAKVG